MRRMLLLMAVLLPLLFIPAYAVDVEQTQWGSIDSSTLEGMTEGYLDDVTLDSGISLDDGIEQIWNSTAEHMGEVLKYSVKSGALLLLVVVACGVGELLTQTVGGTALPVIHMVGAVSVAGIAVSDLSSLIGLGAETINRLSSFTAVLLPVMTSAAAACGHPTSATVRQMVTLLCSNLLVSVIDRLLLPMVYVYVAASTASAALGADNLKPLCRLFKWVICAVLTTLLLLFVSYVTVSGAITGTADETTVKMAKLAISGMVPVVGGILSDATETVLAGAGILRNAVGIFGMLAVLAFCALPFLRLGCQYLVYKLVHALSATISQGRTAQLIGELGSVFGLVLGMTGACAFVVMVSLVATVSVAVT